MYFQMSKKCSLVATICGQYLARPLIEVATHGREVKGIKSYLTLSGRSRSQGQTVHPALYMNDFTLHRRSLKEILS